MKRHTETPVQNLTLERKESFRGAKKEGLANAIIPCFTFFSSSPLLSTARLTRGQLVVTDMLFQISGVAPVAGLDL